MNRILVCLIILLSVPNSLVSSQTSADEMSVALERLFREIRTGQNDSMRLAANDSAVMLIDRFAASPEVFRYQFRNIRNLGQIGSSDSALKIISWNIVLENEPSRYCCYIIKRSEETGAGQVFRFLKSYSPSPVRTDITYTQSDWYGALYYDIRPAYTGGSKAWMVLGISYSDSLMTRKIIDVLSFAPDGKPVLGRKWFDNGKTVNYRHILEYSWRATITLRFMNDKQIVFDHLVPIPRPGEAGRLEYGPDFSYDAFIFNDGIWNLATNVDARNMEKQQLRRKSP